MDEEEDVDGGDSEISNEGGIEHAVKKNYTHFRASHGKRGPRTVKKLL